MLSAYLLDVFPFGVVVLNHRARILFANAYASDFLHVSAELHAVDGFLRARSASHRGALQRALHRLTHETTHGPIGFSIARPNQRPISVVLIRLPARARARTAPPPDRSRIGLFLSDPEFGARLSAPLVRQVFELTPVESSIAILMMESRDTAAIAKALTITRNTLRDHLKAMFSKTGTRNQGELLHALLRSPASLRLPNAITASSPSP